MASNIIGNRNSTPEASKTSLRPPSSRTLGNNSGTHSQTVRASADMSFASPLSARSIRPASEVLYNQQSQHGSLDDSSKLGEQWIQDIEQYETMLEEMAAATLDQDFKDELSAIEQWFRVLSEAERTAATYALIQQTTQMQQRFFAQVLNQMSKSHPISGVLSPANFGEKDAMCSRLNDAMTKLNVDDRRTSIGRPPLSPAGNKRNSGLDQSTINAMFPDAVAAIQQQRAEYAQQTGNPPPSNRNSTIIGDRSSLITPTISAPRESKSDAMSWRQGAENQQPPISRPKSSSGQHQQQQSQQQQPMGHFSQPQSSGGLRSPRPGAGQTSNIQSTTLTAPDPVGSDMPLLSPYNVGNQSWASMTNTPMVPNFSQAATHSDMVANATAMKLAALSTVNNRIALDDAKKYRRARSNEPQPQTQSTLSPGVTASGIPGINTIMVNDQGQILNAQQVAAIQAQQIAAAQGRRSRPNSPGLPLQTPLGQTSFASPQHNGFLAAYEGAPIMMGAGMAGLIPQIGSLGAEGYLSDHSEIARGRSPRGRRGSSKPPEDPTDPSLLQDIPAWLRSLRLHKYTDNLKDLKWDELVQLDDKGLEARGVNALGARNKMLKVFEQVKEAQSEGKL
ncbi:Flap-structured DNA-binding and RNA-binding protein [Exophiala dermatitidis]|uniref:RNA-binding protein VTS1 n=2 Tax=Exophiala dermatitidis TaxID=5970 RepID=H6BSL5_EXODN|nr:protein vts1 [Exophiala dermatitidis NIH/UT8656]KAJ4519115.1 Flap-structured DNA-binding and RNA-binding protein [Exophiala dermatitidis]EHY53367.1 protein vts1 [Exophiala dermatitidis NIH/UT8656]KAJ4522460.1 Flap-structured DNA-binding and RNA-binding protein [Exophiala dermatitidis]KAJ4529784.1 Flap-structured DNA-binding and RNA-binding protein [Exophiala dermatitidis]KAJ4543548.1 Flap-structured DNA-binding and RNA-binding protein [Exophiala dermatitidis]